MSLYRNPLTRCLGVAALVALGACQDGLAPAATSPRATSFSPAILDGAHGGNQSVFFLPPMVSNPTGQPGFGDAVQTGLPVAFRVERLFRAGYPNCTAGVEKEFPTSAVQFQTDHYQVDWHTDDTDLHAECTYRIEVIIGKQMEAFADVDVVTNGSQLKNVVTQEFIPLLDGRTLPIKVRVEQGVTFCTDANCVSQVVTNDVQTIVKTLDENAAAEFPAGWFDPDEVHSNQVIVTIEDVTSQVTGEGKPGCGLGVTKMVSPDAHCVRFSTSPRVTNNLKEITVMVCQEDRGDHNQMLLKYDVDEAPKFLANATPPFVCPEDRISSTAKSSGVMHLASAVLSRLGRAVQSLVGPRPAYAFDLGVGGTIGIGGGFSVITAAHPFRIAAFSEEDQSGPAGQILRDSPTVQLVYLHHSDGPVGPNDATVRCKVVGSNGRLVVSDGEGTIDVTEAPATRNDEEDEDGVYHCPGWRPGPGDNTVQVIVDNMDADVVVPFSEEGVYHPTHDFHAFGTVAGGSDVVVLGSASIFGDVAAADANNQRFFKNLVSFYTATTHGNGTHVRIDCSHGTPVSFCSPGSIFTATLNGAGYSVDASRTLSSPIPANVKLIILAPATTNYSSAELIALHDFAAQGGRVVFITERATDDLAGQLAVVNQFRSQFALSPLAGIGPRIFGCPDGDGTFGVIPSSRINDGSPLTAGLTQLTIGCSSEVNLDFGTTLFWLMDGEIQHTLGLVIPLGSID